MNKHRKNCNVDVLRHIRTNVPEVVFAPFKDDHSLINSIQKLYSSQGRVLVTKCSKMQQKLLRKKFLGKIEKMDETSGTIIISKKRKCLKPDFLGSVVVLAAGSSDYFVSEEASISCEFLGLKAYRYYDCGVAGIHRLDDAIKIINQEGVDCVIVVAGMEGALPSIVAGLVKQPIIAVPTSVGYGTSYKGITALLAMLNSCSPGISVVNIDNGFGAAACAYKMIKWMKKSKK